MKILMMVDVGMGSQRPLGETLLDTLKAVFSRQFSVFSFQ